MPAFFTNNHVFTMYRNQRRLKFSYAGILILLALMQVGTVFAENASQQSRAAGWTGWVWLIVLLLLLGFSLGRRKSRTTVYRKFDNQENW